MNLFRHVVFATCLGISIAGCGSDGNNSRPTADAGADQTVLPGATVALDGSASSDADGDALSFAWSLRSKPEGSVAALSSTTSIAPSFTTDKAGIYVASLVVDDGKAVSTPADVTITANTVPEANAGPAQNTIVGTLVTLYGHGSSDADGHVLKFSWTLTSKPEGSLAALSDATSITPTFTPDKAGIYRAQLVVSDGLSSSNPAVISVTVRKEINSPPVANAGPSQTVLVGDTVTLDGSASFDPDGDPLTFNWIFNEPTPGRDITLSDPTSATPSFVAKYAGLYSFTLVVSDGTLTADKSVVISVDVRNHPPTASAGLNQTVVPGAVVLLDGHKSFDYDGDPLTYVWTLTTVPSGSTATLIDPTSPTSRFTADVVGTYVASLVVNDGTEDSIAYFVTITCDTLQSMALAPSPFATGVGITRGMTAIGTFSNGSTASLSSGVSWSSLDPAVATVDATGLVTGVALGSTSISAAAGSVSATDTVIVSADTWWPAAPMSKPRTAPIRLLSEGKVIVLGGDAVPTMPFQSSEIYDSVRDRWSPVNPMNDSARVSFSATVLADGRLLIAGGYRNAAVKATAEIYNPITDTVSAAGNMLSPRFGQAAVLLASGKVYVYGGSSAHSGGYLNSAEIYDPVTNTWSAAAPLPALQLGSPLLLPNGKLLAVDVQNESGVLTTHTYLYEPAADRWTAGSNMPAPRIEFSETLLANGMVMFAGGRDLANSQSARVDLYDPATDTWTSAANLQSARYSAGAVRLDSGKVLVFGGNDAGGPLASAEIYDPVADAWSPAANMIHALSGAGFLLPNHTVLAVGATESELYW